MLCSLRNIATWTAAALLGAATPALAQTAVATPCPIPPVAQPDQSTPLHAAAGLYARTQFAEALTRPNLLANLHAGIAQSMTAGAIHQQPPQELIALVQDVSERATVRCMPTIMSIIHQRMAAYAVENYDLATLNQINAFFGSAAGAAVLEALNSLPETAQIRDLYALLSPADGDAYRRFLASPAGQQLSAKDPLLRQAGMEAADRAVVAVQPVVQAEAIAAVRRWMAERQR